MFERTTELRVRYAETDQMGVVYHANYLIWCDIGRTELLRDLGVRYAELERQGVLLAVSESRMRFHAPARYDDCVRVRTRLTRVRSRVVSFSYSIEKVESSEALAWIETDLVCLSVDRRPRRLPDALRARLELAVESGDGTPGAAGGVLIRGRSPK